MKTFNLFLAFLFRSFLFAQSPETTQFPQTAASFSPFGLHIEYGLNFLMPGIGKKGNLTHQVKQGTVHNKITSQKPRIGARLGMVWKIKEVGASLILVEAAAYINQVDYQYDRQLESNSNFGSVLQKVQHTATWYGIDLFPAFRLYGGPRKNGYLQVEYGLRANLGNKGNSSRTVLSGTSDPWVTHHASGFWVSHGLRMGVGFDLKLGELSFGFGRIMTRQQGPWWYAGTFFTGFSISIPSSSEIGGE